MESVKELQEIISKKFDESVVQEIVKTQINHEEFEIIKIDLGAATTKGDNFMSDVTRFSIETKDLRSNKVLTINVIVKAYPKSLGRRLTFRSLDFFKTEVAFFEKVWPKLDAFQKSKNISGIFENIPKILAYHIDADDGFIAMEDLTFQGFTTITRLEPLDLDHVETLLKLFAHFHALAFAYKQENEDEFQLMANALHENYFSEELRSWIGPFYQNIQGVVKDAVKHELDEVYYKKICSEFDKDVYGGMAKLCGERTSRFVTITHGDPWIPNFLFQYSDGKPSYVKLIDYQLTRVSSLALDLLFFIYSCTCPSLRASHFPHLLSTYVSAFNLAVNNLLSTSTAWLTVTQLRAEMKRCSAFGLGICSEANVMTLLDGDDEIDLGEKLDCWSGDSDGVVKVEDVFVVRCFKDRAKRQRVAGFLKDMIDEGFV